MRDYTVFDFYLGDSEDDATQSWQLDDLQTRPMVGEKMSFWSTRDDNGNYVHKDHPREMFSGIITRIEHVIEERGNDAEHNHKVHFVQVYLKPIS